MLPLPDFPVEQREFLSSTQIFNLGNQPCQHAP